MDNFNLDATEPSDLMKFWAKYRKGARRADCAELFNGTKPARYTVTAASLANYASNKATAMECRLRGDINIALAYEAICDRIYEGLPSYARW